MQIAAGTPQKLGPQVAVALLAGAMCCLWLPWLAQRWLLVLLMAAGVLAWWKAADRAWIGAALLGFGWAGIVAGNAVDARLPAEMEGRALVIEGRVDDLPRSDAQAARFTFTVDDTAAQPEALRGRRLRLGWFAAPGQSPPRVDAGSRWTLNVSLKRPHGLRNPGVLDSERGMLVERIAAVGSVRHGTNVETQAGDGIEAVRGAVATHIDAGANPSRRFIRALAIGDTRALTDADWTVLRASGLTHLIAISGSHVALSGLLSVALAWLLWRAFPQFGHVLPKRTAMALSGVAVAVFYTALAGSEVPTLRTLLMMAGIGGSILLRRRLGVAHALAVAAIALTLVDPLNLLRPGFWLSFAGVGWLAWSLRDGGRGVVREFLSAQGVATIGLLPLTMLFFAQASWISPLANLVAVPWWGFVIVPLSLLGVLADAIHAGAANALWTLAATLFDATWPLFQRMAAWPVAQSTLPEPALFAWPLALIGAWWLLGPRALPGKPLALALWFPMFTPVQPAPLPGEATVHVLDVGQGQAVLVRTANHALLYDAGPAVPDGYDAGKNTVLPALAALGVQRLDMMMLSHADADHAGGMQAVEAGISVAAVQAPPGAPLMTTANCGRGQHWEWDGVAFEVIAPSLDSTYRGNDSSCVVRVSASGHAILLTGDIPSAVESALVLRDPAALQADVVLMPHHGSAGSSSRGFIEATHARWAIASAGYRNRYHHPNPKALQRWEDAGTRVIDTPHAGAVRIQLDASNQQPDTERARRRRIWDSAG